MAQISASVWSADLSNLESEVKKMEKYVDSFHFDVGDGHFIQNLLFFPDLIASLRKKTKLPFEVHLMVNNPENFINAFEDSADLISFHPNSTSNAKKLIKLIQKKNIKVGIIINTNEKIENLKDLICIVDKVTLMGTKLGVKGQNFNKKVLSKISKVKNILKNKKSTLIEIDGGIREETIEKMFESGADSVVAGSLIFNENYKKMSKWIHNL